MEEERKTKKRSGEMEMEIKHGTMWKEKKGEGEMHGKEGKEIERTPFLLLLLQKRLPLY